MRVRERYTTVTGIWTADADAGRVFHGFSGLVFLGFRLFGVGLKEKKVGGRGDAGVGEVRGGVAHDNGVSPAPLGFRRLVLLFFFFFKKKMKDVRNGKGRLG